MPQNTFGDWVNIGSGSGLVPAGNMPLLQPMLTQICVTIYNHWATQSVNPLVPGIAMWR